MIAVSAIAAAAIADALRGSLPDNPQLLPQTGTTTEPATDSTTESVILNVEEPAPIGRCKQRQLELSAGLRDGPIVRLGYRRGPACRVRPMRIFVRITSGSGTRGRGTLFGPEPDRFRGPFETGRVFEPGTSEVAAFRYSPRCGEEGPFSATVIAGPYAMKIGRLVVDRCGEVIPEDA